MIELNTVVIIVSKLNLYRSVFIFILSLYYHSTHQDNLQETQSISVLLVEGAVVDRRTCGFIVEFISLSYKSYMKRHTFMYALFGVIQSCMKRHTFVKRHNLAFRVICDLNIKARLAIVLFLDEERDAQQQYIIFDFYV